MIDAVDLSKKFGDRDVLKHVNFKVEPGETIAVIGPSGCGKSTLLRLLSGLEVPDAGSIKLESDNFTMVFQYSALFDGLSVFENVAFSLLEESDIPGVERRKVPRKKIRKLVRDTLSLLGLEDIEDLFPSQLSGGMQKRVSFARAVIGRPDLIFYDEPTAGLDPIATTATEDMIALLQKELGATSILVTHNLSTIRRIVDRVFFLYDGEFKWIGSDEEFFTTDNPYAKQFATANLHGPMTDGVHN